MTLSRRVRGLLLVASTGLMAACAGATIADRPRAPEAKAAVPLSELWIEPTDLAERNLFWGSGRQDSAPSSNVEYKVVKLDTTGYSKGYDVTGPDGRKWAIKLGKEAQPEIVVSRILWALGYHQPETYYLTGWRLAGTWESEGEPARFRLQSDHETDGEWKWLENPFKDTVPLRGLIGINLLVMNWDFKTGNNRIYRLRDATAEPRRRYVVQDLGASLGRPPVLPGIIRGTRNDIDDYESLNLTKKVLGSKVELDYRSVRRDVIEIMSITDVIWGCELMNRLTDAQLDDAFKAAEYAPSIRQRYITKLRAKIQEGLALRPGQEARSRKQG